MVKIAGESGIAQFDLAKADLAPYYWASFEIVGDPHSSRLLRHSDPPRSRLTISVPGCCLNHAATVHRYGRILCA